MKTITTVILLASFSAFAAPSERMVQAKAAVKLAQDNVKAIRAEERSAKVAIRVEKAKARVAKAEESLKKAQESAVASK